jgi:hypothetical protein
MCYSIDGTKSNMVVSTVSSLTLYGLRFGEKNSENALPDGVRERSEIGWLGAHAY